MLSVGCILCIINDHGGCYREDTFYASLMLLGALSAPYGYVIVGWIFMHRLVDVIGWVDFVCTVRLMPSVGWIFYAPFG
jgi:hypothetical protein